MYSRVRYYPDSQYVSYQWGVYFWYEGPQVQSIDDALITGIRFDAHTKNLDRQLELARALLPADAEFKETREGFRGGDRYTIYHSKSLETRYPPLPSAPDPWKDKTHGEIVVIRFQTSVSVRANVTDLPAIHPPTEVPPPTVTPGPYVTAAPIVTAPVPIPTTGLSEP
jgi:hypothetical protein